MLVTFLLITILFGLGFLGIKAVEYHDHWVHGQFPGANFRFSGPNPLQVEMYFSFYWAMTGFHALHVLIGIGLVTYMRLSRLERGLQAGLSQPGGERRSVLALRRLVWVYLYPLLYLISHKHVSG